MNWFTEQLTHELANYVLRHKSPHGLYYVFHEDGDWSAIDNSTGEAFVHECESEQACIEWLLKAPAQREQNQ